MPLFYGVEGPVYEDESGLLVYRSDYEALAAQLAAANSRAEQAEQRAMAESELAEVVSVKSARKISVEREIKEINQKWVGQFLELAGMPYEHPARALSFFADLRRQLAEAQAELARVRVRAAVNAHRNDPYVTCDEFCLCWEVDAALAAPESKE